MATKFPQLTRFPAAEKSLSLVLGTGRCGTVSLARFLNASGTVATTHESRPLLPWDFDELVLAFKLHQLALRDAPHVGDASPSYLPYVEAILDQVQSARFICLRRDRAEVVRSFLAKTGARNHWSSRPAKPDLVFDPVFPKYDDIDKASAIGRYWDDYDAKSRRLARDWPANFLIIETKDLSAPATRDAICDFLRIPSRTMPACITRENRTPERVSVRPAPFTVARLRRSVRRSLHHGLRVFHRARLQLATWRGLGGDPSVLSVLVVHVRRPLSLFENFVQGIANQRLPDARVELLVATEDLDANLDALRRLAGTSGFALVVLPRQGVFCKARFLNALLPRAHGRHVLVADPDIIFAPDYLSAGVRRLRSAPNSLVLCDCRDLVEHTDPTLPLDWLRRLSVPRRASHPTPGILLAARDHLVRIGGYDEALRRSGAEDSDVVLRLLAAGLDAVTLTESFCVHQWQPIAHSP